MIRALYSKDPAERRAFVEEFAAGSAGPVIHVYPKNAVTRVAKLPRAYSVTFEDLTKRDHWLHVNSLVGPSTTLILENVSRYPKATTPKSRALRRLSMVLKRKALVDIVPFTLDVQYLYTPLSFLSRSILGYAHNFAFRENYQELDDDGRIRYAHDPEVLAAKMVPTCEIRYASFLCPTRRTVLSPVTPAEADAYQVRRDELFAHERSPQRIITRLADTVHAFESRTARLLEVLDGMKGDVLVFTNLASYAKRTQAAVRAAGFRNVTATSYQLGASRQGDHVIYLESPIVNSFYLLDAESMLGVGASIHHFCGDTKVDRYLYGEITHELTQIDQLTRALYDASPERT